MTEQQATDLSYLDEMSDEAMSDGMAEHDELLNTTPFISVVKKNSPKVTQGLAKAGDIWSGAHDQTLGELTIEPGEPPILRWEEGVEIIPLQFEIEWRETEYEEDKKKSRLIKSTWDYQQAIEWWGEDGEWRHQDLVIAMLIGGAPAVMRCSGFDTPIARDFYRSCKKPKAVIGEGGQEFRQIPIRAQVWTLTTQFNAKNENFAPKFRFARVANLEDYKTASAIGDQVSVRRLSPPPDEEGVEVKGEAAQAPTKDKEQLPF